MTKKDYVLLATVLRQAERSHLGESEASWTADWAWKRASEAVADALSSDNPRFDRARFLSAVRGEGK